MPGTGLVSDVTFLNLSKWYDSHGTLSRDDLANCTDA